jgi:hypothetical protein
MAPRTLPFYHAHSDIGEDTLLKRKPRWVRPCPSIQERPAGFDLPAYWDSLWHETFVIFVGARYRDNLILPVTSSSNHPHD